MWPNLFAKMMKDKVGKKKNNFIIGFSNTSLKQQQCKFWLEMLQNQHDAVEWFIGYTWKE